MICGQFHAGSGLGDQLFRYITTRTLATDKGFVWGMMGTEQFKGSSFMQLDMGCPVNMNGPREWMEKDIRDLNGTDIRSYDPEINFVDDNTVIDGCFEDEKYWGHRIQDIRKWLAVEPINMSENTCVIGFRGGEYATVPELFLPQDYWDLAISLMEQKYPHIQFEVHTDDPSTAQQFFPRYPIFQGIDINWRSVRYAKHLIIANSAFYIMPSLLGEAKEVIAPRYWARRNRKTWARPSCYYKDSRFMYI